MMEVIMLQLAIPLSHHVFRSGLVPLQLLPRRAQGVLPMAAT
eukprot:CAMPEP_0181508282 /NCGR_PEP_ID=MMETSP1110-20121109/59643_1 /TAXON_ID=174948 /ORGANISM="Symbiodinium sp., Strain CCMP421" /LENGTH=41 /DNA_ID= /DNA_START= /DNA_END= /DNA_ORIENTATION=